MYWKYIVKYKIEHNRDFDYLYGEFGIAFLFLVGYFIYEITQKSRFITLIIFIGPMIILLLITLSLLIYILKRKYIYINTIADKLEYKNFFGSSKSIKLHDTNRRYKIMVDNNSQFVYRIEILNKKNKRIFKMWNSEMNFNKQESKIILGMLIDKAFFTSVDGNYLSKL